MAMTDRWADKEKKKKKKKHKGGGDNCPLLLLAPPLCECKFLTYFSPYMFYLKDVGNSFIFRFVSLRSSLVKMDHVA